MIEREACFMELLTLMKLCMLRGCMKELYTTLKVPPKNDIFTHHHYVSLLHTNTCTYQTLNMSICTDHTPSPVVVSLSGDDPESHGWLLLSVLLKLSDLRRRQQSTHSLTSLNTQSPPRHRISLSVVVAQGFGSYSNIQ